MVSKKAIVIGLVLVVAAGANVWAAGQGERPSDVEPGRRLTADTQDVTVTGTIEYRDGYPVLVAGDDVYSIGTRRGGRYADDLEEGMELTVSGEKIDALDDSRSGADYHIFVSTAEADGETIEFDDARGRTAADGSFEMAAGSRGGRNGRSANSTGGGPRRGRS